MLRSPIDIGVAKHISKNRSLYLFRIIINFLNLEKNRYINLEFSYICCIFVLKLEMYNV